MHITELQGTKIFFHGSSLVTVPTGLSWWPFAKKIQIFCHI